jgi:membrane protease YdiL (CAAX protease family)
MSSVKSALWNESQGRLRAGWRLAIQLILNIGLVLPILSLARSRPGSFDPDSSWGMVAVAAMTVGATLLSVWLAGRFLDRRLFSDFGLHLNRASWWAEFAFGLVLGITLPLGLALAGMAAGVVRLEPAYSSGFPGLSFGIAVLLSAFVYLCVGVFEEVGRAYHVRNLFEGTARGLGSHGAAVLAVLGASVISVIMHSGNLAFMWFVLLATAMKGMWYLLTGRVGIALGYHAAWDFAMVTILGIGAQSDANGTTAFYLARFEDVAWASAANSGEITLPALLALLALELVALLLILGWVRFRQGKVTLCEELATPSSREPVMDFDDLVG